MPWVAEAAGLGRLTVISGLGEPLNAEIELISTTPEELSTLTAGIAPQEAYEIQGIERTGIHNAIKIDVDKRPGGTPILKLSTRQPVSDPFLDMLIQVDWATGRLLREYTVLLDPPGYDGQPAADSSTAPTVAQPSTAEPVPEARPDSASGEMSAMPDSDAAVAPDSRETARGDTLSSIAREMQVEGVSLEQMLVGLYRANKDAFVDGNMNRLRVGEIIRAPAPEELAAIDRQEAAQEIRVQTADWNAYRNRLAGIVADSAAASEDVSNQSTSGALTGPAEDRAAPPSDAAQDVIKLSKSDTSNTANKDLQDKLNALQEEVIARENSLNEANERTAALEKQIQDMQQLLAIKNEALANAQQNAAGQNPPAANGDTPAAAAGNAAQPSAPAATPSQPAAQPEAAKPQAAKPAPKQPVAAPEAAGTNFLDDLLQNQLLPLIAAGLPALLVVMWLFLRNKRRRDLDSFEKGILTSGGLKANTVFGNTAGDTVDTGDTSFLTDFSQSTGGMIDTHDVDPIAEAEVYMAYGRDAQAEEILKDAIAKEPKRYELHLKLLEIFAARNDTASFETVAGELYSTLGAADPNWAKVAEIGRKLEPDNPLYTTAAAGAAVGTVAAGAARAEPAPPEEQLASDIADAELINSAGLDFSFDADKPDESVPPQNSGVMELDQKTLPAAYAEEPMLEGSLQQAVTVMDEPQADDKTMDYQLDAPQPLAADTVQLDASDFGQTISFENTVLDHDALAFDLPELAAATPPDEPEVKTELPDLSFDLPQSETVTEDQPPADVAHELPSLDFTSFDESKLPDLDLTAQASDEQLEEKIVFEAMPEKAQEITLDFDTAPEPTESTAPADLKAPSMDLSSISLDLNEGAADDANKAMSAESADVNTKIDLVNAYIDMDDIEGAKELLEEVLKEGGPNQRQHAQKILNSLA